MREIIYYVAISIDGYIAGSKGDASEFKAEGEGVSQYLQDLQTFDTVVMGRRTYEFGYQFGLIPGQPAYPHMEHYIFSNTLQLDDIHPQVNVESLDIDKILELKRGSGPPIYLCGGGIFAGWLLNHKLIDQVKIKLNPLLLGNGIPLFVGAKTSHQLLVTDKMDFDDIQIISYKVQYGDV